MNIPGTYTGVRQASTAHDQGSGSCSINSIEAVNSFDIVHNLEVLNKPEFALDASTKVLESIAINPNSPTCVLRKLASHSEPDLRATLAENKNTPADCIFDLMHDENPEVRYQLAENHQLALEFLEILTNDENPFVACRARKTICRVEQEIASRQNRWYAFRTIQTRKGLNDLSNNAATPVELLRKLCSRITRSTRAV